MLVSNTPLPAAATPPKRPQAPPAASAATAPKRAAPDPEVSAAVARAEDAADKSKTARRDALSGELTRLMAIAREMNRAGGDLRSSADALQDLARQIAKVARALADAERALPAAQRRGVPHVAVPRAAAAAPAAAEDKPAEAAGAEAAGAEARAKQAEAAAEPAADPAGAVPATPEAAADPAAANPAASDRDDPLDPEQRAEERRERARSGREGTRQLLLTAADLLDAIRKTVRKAELFENLLDPEAAKERGKAGAEIEGLAIELRGLAGRFADPTQGLGVDVTA